MTNHEQAMHLARERYATLGVEVEQALEALSTTALSLHCWQGDDVRGFETPEEALSGGGLAVTGNHPGRARTLEELRADLEQALALIPGRHRVNLHAMYGDFTGPRVERDAIETIHYQTWVEWARGQGLGLDFNATCFSHPLAEQGFTLASLDDRIRDFWVRHVERCREVGAWMGQQLGTPCLHNLWIPDGAKDLTVRRYDHRARLCESLDTIYATPYPRAQLRDSVESKLFGIGSEAYVVGSYDFYLAWALPRGMMVCLDLGHFHPTESVADKISSLLMAQEELLLHVSRGLRWDSDHVVIWDDQLRALAEEIVRAGALSRVHLALDYFDASINRVGAWVIGARATLKAFLHALLEPTDRLRQLEEAGDLCGRLGLLEEIKTLPFGAVWDEHCLRHEVPIGEAWLDEVREYEARILRQRPG